MNFVTEKAVTWLINKESNRDLTAFREWMNTEVIPKSRVEEEPERLVEPDEVMAVMEATAIRIEKLTKKLNELEKKFKSQPVQQTTVVVETCPKSTVAAFVESHKLPVDRKEYSYYSVVARSICRIRGIKESKTLVNGVVKNAYPVDVLLKVFEEYGCA